MVRFRSPAPSTSSRVQNGTHILPAPRGGGAHTEGFPSGQREQTVNLLSTTSVVRIHPLPPSNSPVATDRAVALRKGVIRKTSDRWFVRAAPHTLRPTFPLSNTTPLMQTSTTIAAKPCRGDPSGVSAASTPLPIRHINAYPPSLPKKFLSIIPYQTSSPSSKNSPDPTPLKPHTTSSPRIEVFFIPPPLCYVRFRPPFLHQENRINNAVFCFCKADTRLRRRDFSFRGGSCRFRRRKCRAPLS